MGTENPRVGGSIPPLATILPKSIPDTTRVRSSSTAQTDVPRRPIQRSRRNLIELVPAEDPAVADLMWIEPASQHFKSNIIVGKDLLEIQRKRRSVDDTGAQAPDGHDTDH